MAKVTKLCLSAVLGGIIFFAWSSMSWMVLDWHRPTIHEFKDVQSVSAILTSNTDKSGIYYLSPYGKTGKVVEGRESFPTAFVAINKDNIKSMNTALVMYFVAAIVSALLISCLLCFANLSSYPKRVIFIPLVALTAGVLCYAPEFIWWHFDPQFIQVNVADLLIGWFLAGLVMAGICK